MLYPEYEHDGSEDLIDSFFSGDMWSSGVPGAQVLIGRIQQESQPAVGQDGVTKRNLYSVRTTQGHVIPDCFLLSSSAFGAFGTDPGVRFRPDEMPGQYSKPYPGSLCVVVTSNGGAAFIVGFFNPPTTTTVASDPNTGETKPGSVDDAEARSSGDWIVRTEASLLNMKRMGAIVIQSGASIRQTMNPLDGTYFSQCKRRIDVSEGYRAERSRVQKSSPEALSTEEFYDKILQRGRSSVRVRIRNGQVDSSVRHEVMISDVNYAVPTDPVTTDLARSAYDSDGSWFAEGPKFQWGGRSADEPIVLGNKLVAALEKLIGIIGNIRVNTAWGPSTTPLPPTPIDLQALENELGDILSEYMFTTRSAATPGGL